MDCDPSTLVSARDAAARALVLLESAVGRLKAFVQEKDQGSPSHAASSASAVAAAHSGFGNDIGPGMHDLWKAVHVTLGYVMSAR